MACFRFKMWWMAQRMGDKGGDVPHETQFLLVESKAGDGEEDGAHLGAPAAAPVAGTAARPGWGQRLGNRCPPRQKNTPVPPKKAPAKRPGGHNGWGCSHRRRGQKAELQRVWHMRSLRLITGYKTITRLTLYLSTSRRLPLNKLIAHQSSASASIILQALSRGTSRSK